jgi:hypothetical protein
MLGAVRQESPRGITELTRRSSEPYCLLCNSAVYRDNGSRMTFGTFKMNGQNVACLNQALFLESHFVRVTDRFFLSFLRFHSFSRFCSSVLETVRI